LCGLFRYDDLAFFRARVQDIDLAIAGKPEGVRQLAADHAENRLAFFIAHFPLPARIGFENDFGIRQFDVEPRSRAESILDKIVFVRHPNEP